MSSLATVDLFQYGTYYCTVHIAGDRETMQFAKDWVAENTEAMRRAEVLLPDGVKVTITTDNDGLPFETT